MSDDANDTAQNNATHVTSSDAGSSLKTPTLSSSSRPQFAPMRESRTRQALQKQRHASQERKLAYADGPSAAAQLQSARDLEAEAAELMKPIAQPTIRNGEVLSMPDDTGPVWEIADTLRNPDQAAIDASIERTNLLYKTGLPGFDIVALAVDTAASLKAKTAPEKMLAHQLAGIHVMTMKAMQRALEFERREGMYGEGFKTEASIEFARQANSVVRLSVAFQEGLLTLQRLKTGASQTVTVRHVTVQAGAQAVIGNVKAGGVRASKTRRRAAPK